MPGNDTNKPTAINTPENVANKPTAINTKNNNTKTITTTNSSPKTGDDIIIWIGLWLGSALGIIGTIRGNKKS